MGLEPPRKPSRSPSLKTVRYNPKYVISTFFAAKVMALRCGVRSPTTRGPPNAPALKQRELWLRLMPWICCAHEAAREKSSTSKPIVTPALDVTKAITQATNCQ
mmetsp:Transcript_43090/g.77385  ORF Transcript_43090/g.77385 Transcript_43090/m.77385 type:complete len:104 (-) Transcript_43090:31-342(-)